jgi:hypothetical protein
VRISPEIYRVGHIVELQVAFCVRAAKKKGEWYFCQELRAISLLDTVIEKVNFITEMDKSTYIALQALLQDRFNGLGDLGRLLPVHAIKRVRFDIPEDPALVLARKKMKQLTLTEPGERAEDNMMQGLIDGASKKGVQGNSGSEELHLKT